MLQEKATTLIANNDGNCPDTIQKMVNINEVLIYYVPNTFTPDEDTYNTLFQPIFTDGFDPYNFSMTIYNRWGEIVFSTNSKEGWNGNYNGNSKPCPEGVYVYKLDVFNDPKHKIYTGTVSLIR